MGVPLDQGNRKGNVDIFVALKTDKAGAVKGESTDAKHPDEIEISGWGWGMASASNISTGQATGRRMHKPLTLYKNIDAATCPLAIALVQNQTVKELKLTCRKAGTGAALEYLIITIKNGRVARFDLEYLDQSVGGTGREVVEITFQEITIEYTPQSKVGLSNATKTFTDSYTENQ